jgi:hypothetical protein
VFRLPWSTTLLLLGAPLAWILYTLGFLAVSRDWERDEVDEP